MSYTEYIPEATDLTLYAKVLPLDEGTWANGIVAFNESGSTGQYIGTLDETEKYFVYLQAGEDPASTDEKIGSISPSNLTANAIESVGAAVSVTVTPSSGTVPERAGSSYIRSFNKETGTFSITVLDSANQPVDLTGVYEDLGVYWETETKVAVGSVTSGITLGGTGNATLSFALPTAVAATDRRLIFAVREREDEEMVYIGGTWDVQYLPAGS